jgi:carbamoyltransferase
MYILGISCYYHDAAAALLHDGVLIAAAEEERFTRKKHDSGFPHKAIEFCLAQAGIRQADVDYVVFYEKPLLKFERLLLSNLATYPNSWAVFRESMLTWFNEKLWIKTQLLDKLRLADEKLLFVEHHLSHAASAFFCSPFEESAIVTVDGVGEWTTTAIGHGQANWGRPGDPANALTLSAETRFPHSLGLLYSAFTAFLGFEVNDGEYKVMGMAPFGQPNFAEDVYKLIEVAADGSFRLKMDYFSFHQSLTRTYSRKFPDIFGAERKHESEFFTPKTHPGREPAKAAENQRYADLAASIQYVTEEVLLKIARHAHTVTGSKRLCLAGGVALNSVANGRILTEGPFEEVFIQPAAGDSGGAIGAALYAYHVLLNQPRKFVMEHAYWGQGYSPDEVRDFLDKNSIAYTQIDDDDKLADQVVDTLTQGRVVGWFQGRFEWGPRALGNRSILADPTRAEMKDIVNTKIKFREPFRPFAPVVLEERSREYFVLDQPQKHYPARYMLLVADIPADKQASIPAVTHVNGTGRLQTLKRETNPRYYRVIEKFGERTGVPVLLNTSFNLRGEPIVNTPANAFSTFSRSDIDVLVLGNMVVRKQGS